VSDELIPTPTPTPTPTPEALPEVVSTILASPDADVPPDKLLELLQIWKIKVEKEIADYDEERSKLMVVYKRQKDMYDKWLSGRLKKVKKFDNLINGRKKVLIDVNKEINKLSETLSPPSNAQQ
jgi:hypothetical protein